MNIDRKKLIGLIAEKAGMDPKAAEEQLDALVERVIETSMRGKALEIKGFGMFYLSQSQELTFEPSRELQTEINYRYAGMEPVEIRKPRHKEGEEQVSEESDEKKSDADSAAEIWGTGLDLDMDSVGEKDEEISSPEILNDGDGPESEPRQSEQNLEEWFETGPEEDTAGKKEDDRLKESGPEEELAPVTAGSKKPDVQDRKPETKPKSPEKKKERNPVSMLITVILVVLFLVIGGIVAMDLGWFGASSDRPDVRPPVVSQQNSPEDPEEMSATGEREPAESDSETEAADDALTALPDDDDDDDEDGQEEEISPVSEQMGSGDSERVEADAEPFYGLQGRALELEGSFYTIVLHSLRSRNRAEGLQDQLADEGYRVVLTSVSHDEHGTMWRVGIGQFESVSSAQNAATELSEPYRQNHFIGIIRQGQ